ncbi:hypothetical protein ACM66B_003329 [Microbotryomycetes sp. NB124-2]
MFYKLSGDSNPPAGIADWSENQFDWFQNPFTNLAHLGFTDKARDVPGQSQFLIYRYLGWTSRFTTGSAATLATSGQWTDGDSHSSYPTFIASQGPCSSDENSAIAAQPGWPTCIDTFWKVSPHEDGNGCYTDEELTQPCMFGCANPSCGVMQAKLPGAEPGVCIPCGNVDYSGAAIGCHYDSWGNPYLEFDDSGQNYWR